MIDPGSDFRILVAGTGAGKTWAAALPIVLRRTCAVLVYPTNALLQDQRRSILALLREHLNVPVQEIGAGEPTGDPGGYTLIHLDADVLEKRRRSRHRRAKGAVLAELLDPSGPRLVLTNPDVLYQVLAWRYSDPGHHLAALQAYPQLVLDEFHLYAGVELANLLGIIGFARAVGAFQRVTVISATADAAVLALLEKAIGTHGQHFSEDATTTAAPVGRDRVLAHEVRLEAKAVSTPGALVNELASLLDGRRSSLQALRERHRLQPDYVPAVAIVNSVIDARQVEEVLIERGWEPGEIAPVRGLVGRSVRDPRGRLLVLGTSAIEVGVDFSTDLLCFQAGDRSSFIQRFGRVGRHGPGEAILLGDAREVAALEAFARDHGGRAERTAVAAFAVQVYAERDSMAWFAATEGGATVLLCLEESVCRAIRSDRGKMSDVDVEALLARVREMVAAHAHLIDADLAKQLARLRLCLEAARRLPKHAYRYLLDLAAAHPTLRTSAPTIQVWDHGEAQRRGQAGAKYEVEVTRIARQGRGVTVKRGEDGELRVFVARYERGGKAWLNEFLRPNRFYRAGDVPELRLCNPQGALPPELFDAENQVLFVADQSIRKNLDWRVAVIPCGEDGPTCAGLGWGALLLREICRRRRNAPP
jgi:CRISPR-associated helicase Cas3